MHTYTSCTSVCSRDYLESDQLCLAACCAADCAVITRCLLSISWQSANISSRGSGLLSLQLNRPAWNRRYRNMLKIRGWHKEGFFKEGECAVWMCLCGQILSGRSKPRPSARATYCTSSPDCSAHAGCGFQLNRNTLDFKDNRGRTSVGHLRLSFGALLCFFFTDLRHQIAKTADTRRTLKCWVWIK